MHIRHITQHDYYDYIKLIDSNLFHEDFNDFLDNVLGETHQIIVLEIEDKLIGTGTLFIENKMSYGGCSMGHIENILIDENFRGKGYGEKIVNELLNIAKEKKCYRVDLNCNSELENFYKKMNFNQKHICMNIYFKENFQ